MGPLAGPPGYFPAPELRVAAAGEELISFGPRFFGVRLSADLHLVISVRLGGTFAFPLINFVWNS